MTSESAVSTSIWAGPISNRCIYMELLFFSVKQTWSCHLLKTYSGKMLRSNMLVAALALCLLISFTEISQGSEKQPKNVNEGMLGLNYYEGLSFWSSSV